jgi:hypothetical protein
MADLTPAKKPKPAGGGHPKDLNPHEEIMAPPVIHLEHHHLEKLLPKGSKMPPVGSKIKISGLAHVGATSEQDESRSPPSHGLDPRLEGEKVGGGKRRSMTLHLHKMDMGQEGISGGEKEESQKAGMKAEIDRVLTKGEGSESEGKAER